MIWRWHSVEKEGYPKLRGSYIITSESKDRYGVTNYISSYNAYYDGECFRENGQKEYHVVAWMPSLFPYREEK